MINYEIIRMIHLILTTVSVASTVEGFNQKNKINGMQFMGNIPSLSREIHKKSRFQVTSRS